MLAAADDDKVVMRSGGGIDDVAGETGCRPPKADGNVNLKQSSSP
jgi:hypothetical protein